MCSIQDLIEIAKSNIEEEVEIQPKPNSISNEMQNRAIAEYDLHQDIIFYDDELVSLSQDDISQTFMHELAHARDFRSCAANGLLKILVQNNGVMNSTFDQANAIFCGVLEFQVSNFLNSKFGYRLRNPRFNEVLYDSMLFSLIPSIEYFCFGEDSELRERFQVKLNRELGSRWLPLVPLLKALELTDELLFETEFLRLTDCLGFTVRMKTETTENIRQIFPVLQDSAATHIKLFELVNFDINRFFTH